eukprot:1471176-Pleurochrysis_carterae.AAC.1
MAPRCRRNVAEITPRWSRGLTLRRAGRLRRASHGGAAAPSPRALPSRPTRRPPAASSRSRASGSSSKSARASRASPGSERT